MMGKTKHRYPKETEGEQFLPLDFPLEQEKSGQGTQNDPGAFYDQQSLSSAVKAKIVSEYFEHWSQIIKVTKKKHNSSIGPLAYIDLYCGPGIYDDGNKSTPILILEKAQKDPEIWDHLYCKFNDIEPQYVAALEGYIEAHFPDIPNKPQYSHISVGDQIVNFLREKPESYSSLSFIDPWGYKGLTMDLICATLKTWGSDAIFFFNYDRINRDINNPIVWEHLERLFTGDMFQRVQAIVRSFKQGLSEEKEREIISCMAEALKNYGGKFVLPFSFKMANKHRTSHYIIFVSKAQKGYEVMKEIMYKNSATYRRGAPHLSYDPKVELLQGTFEALAATSIEELARQLLVKFSGQTLSVENIFHEHNVGTPYCLEHYKDAIKLLYEQHKIKADRAIDKRGVGNKRIITFSIC